MKVDSKFNKRAAKPVACNYTDVGYSRFGGTAVSITLRFHGGQEDGNLYVRMNVLEAHRLITQLNDALAAHAKVAIAKVVQP